MSAAQTAHTRARAKKPEGQWLIDGTDPLNHDEELKQVEPVMQVKQRVIDIYSKQGFDSIPAEDLAPRFKWLGIYTQRKQNLGGEYTGQDNSVLQDTYFMMRIRFDGGQCTTEQARAVGEISRDWRAPPWTSPTARTSSCTGSPSRTSRRSGTSWSPWA